MASADDRLAASRSDDPDRVVAADPDAEIALLQSILLDPAVSRLDAIQARLDDPQSRARDVGAVLPQVLVEHAHDPALARALTGPIEEAVTASVRRNPAPLADALFPVMGPAIRKAVAASLSAMLESFNRTLDHAVSWRSVRWRLEALRTHRSFAEVVLLKTLLHRVEQVFLIDRRSGLLLLYVQPGTRAVADTDMVSGMLTAIRDFVGDSFSVGEGESLEALKVGDLSVLIEPGPRALLAAVVRGTPPDDCRRTLQAAIETIHLQLGDALEAFDGDTTPFEPARPALESCLTSQYMSPERPRRAAAGWIVPAAIVGLLLVWAGLWYRDTIRDRAYLEALGAEPGLIVISSERRQGRLLVAGLRDPLARDPSVLLPAAGLSPADVEARWAPYQSLDPPLVLARARQVLRPPDSAALTFEDGMLSVSGQAPAAWLADATRLAPLIGGVTGLAADPSVLRSVIARTEEATLLFVRGSTRLLPDQDDARTRLLASLTELNTMARVTGNRFAVALVGHTDAEGTDESNLALSVRRAEAVRALLPLDTLSQLDVTATGVGSREPAVTGADEASEPRNRRVTPRVTPVR